LPRLATSIILTKENHSYDNYVGRLDRGDGFTLDAHGHPLNSNPAALGHVV
jgi:phospholipase C